MQKALSCLGISLMLSFAFALAFVIVLTLSLPVTDGAYGTAPFDHPLVFPVMSTVAIVSGLVYWPLFAGFGWHVPPETIVKVTGVATLSFIVVVTPLSALAGWMGSYVVCIGALLYCSARYGSNAAAPAPESTDNSCDDRP